jgi:hypothetical protein
VLVCTLCIHTAYDTFVCRISNVHIHSALRVCMHADVRELEAAHMKYTASVCSTCHDDAENVNTAILTVTGSMHPPTLY